MNNTTNLGLVQFTGTDKFRISQEENSFNKNMEILDTEIPKKADKSIIAQPFSELVANAAGSYVIFQDKLYILPEGHEASVSWANTTKTEIVLAAELAKKYEKPSGGIPGTDLATGVIPDVSGKADNAIIAPGFAAATANDAGSYVIYEGEVYLLPDGHTANAAWADTTKEKVNIGGELTHVKNTYYVYMMTNEYNNVLYVGVTNNLERRVYEHQSGLIEGFTQKYNVHKLVWYESCHDVKGAKLCIDATNLQARITNWKRPGINLPGFSCYENGG